MSQPSPFPINNPRIINAWALFDWANSAFALVITAAIFPAYYAAVVSDTLNILGEPVADSSLYAYAIAAAYLLVAAMSPLLSGIADYSGRKKFFLKIFTTVGALSCMALFFFTGQVAYGTALFILGMMGFAGGLVFYNSYLPLIATEDRYDAVSARGFSYGFVGSTVLLIISLIFILNHKALGFANEEIPTRFSFILVGVWWIGFAQIPFRHLPKDSPAPMDRDVFKKGFQELQKVWRNLQHEPHTRCFLWSFFFLSAGVQTALYLATTFAQKELKLATGELILTIIILQLVGIVGALFFAKLSDWRGNKFTLLLIFFVWILTCTAAYFIQTKLQFYLVASSVGFLMGGTQSLSRSTYSKLLPEGTPDTASYFSFYDITEKIATVLGTTMFGYINYQMDSMRPSVLSLSVFFLMAFLFLQRTRIGRGMRVEG
jgi:UMF1 family MFS transporter